MLEIIPSVPKNATVRAVIRKAPKAIIPKKITTSFIVSGLANTVVVKNLVLSSSGIGKFVLYKNQEPVAALFGSSKDKNCQYQFPIELVNEEELSVEVTNMDLSACDFYVGWVE